MSPPVGPPRTLAELAIEYRHFAEVEAPAHGSPRYAAICTGLADDPEIGGLLLHAPLRFRAPTLLLAAVHHLLLRGLEHRLGGYYPTVADKAARPVDDDLYPAFADLVREHRREVLRLIATRTTQTNEAGRAAVLVPVLQIVAREAGRPVALLEVGSSAGLLLNLDHYGYRIGDAVVGDAGSAVQLACEVQGSLRPELPGEIPPVAWKAGLDRNPLHIGDPETAAWLRALIWPEHRDRLAVLDAALRLAAPHPPDVRRGDLVDGLEDLAAEAPADAGLVILHAWVLAYLTKARRRAFVTAVRRLGAARNRPVWLVGLEAPEILGSLQLGFPGSSPGGYSALALSRFDPNGVGSHRLLAHCHAHGRWLRWLDPASAAPA